MPEDKKPRYKIIPLQDMKHTDVTLLADYMDRISRNGYRVHSTQPDYILMELETPVNFTWGDAEALNTTVTMKETGG